MPCLLSKFNNEFIAEKRRAVVILADINASYVIAADTFLVSLPVAFSRTSFAELTRSST